MPSRTRPGRRLSRRNPGRVAGKTPAGCLGNRSSAIDKALEKVALTPRDIDYICVVTTTGLLCPSLTAHYIKRLDMRPDIQRIDIVGMGCNAGLNGMQPVANFCALHPDAVGLLLCVEVCSAMYVMDDTLNTAVVNSLFGDGAAAAVISAKHAWSASDGPNILGFPSHIIPEAIEAMRLDFRDNKYAFQLDPKIPYYLGLNFRIPVDNLLGRFGRKRRDIDHWVVHSGGRKVIDALKYSLNITKKDVRHTTDILENFGNVSSASFLFAHERLLEEGITISGDSIVMITMGPGLRLAGGDGPLGIPNTGSQGRVPAWDGHLSIAEVCRFRRCPPPAFFR
uniref:Alkylresorcinol/alkylpyrone synthase n=1 Tax=Candidatus Kentrum sp. LFY TaxID=2126342 RepID=A0A450WQA3_9GAMM|nr:MAG: alkylresorcinol/alkylpyrone synthase [Candidatus Kentron sp. LFY]